jgi:hypothetical protein
MELRVLYLDSVTGAESHAHPLTAGGRSVVPDSNGRHLISLMPTTNAGFLNEEH